MIEEPISLYVPARNAAGTLSACLAAVRAQTRPPDDLFILLDPRSGDATAEIALSDGARVVEQTGPTLGSARNQALLAARHRWVACCDSDVIVRPDWLERLAARRGDGAAGIGGRTLERVRNPADAWRAMHIPHHWGAFAFRNPFMLVSEVLFDREALLAVGGYRDDLNYNEDTDLCQRLREGGYDLLYEPAAVAEHQRTDDLIGLLSLRWKYSEHRQRHLLDRYAGLIEKSGVNRAYALNTLARCLAAGREELGYISFLLYYHHLLMDLRSLLSRRPLIDPPTRKRMERALLEAALRPLRRANLKLAEEVRADLDSGDGPASPEAGPRVPPVWTSHLAAVESAAGQFVSSLPESVLGVLAASGAHCHGRLALAGVPRIQKPPPDALRAELAAVPLKPFVDRAFCQALRDVWPESASCRFIGPLAPGEREVVAAVDSRSESATAVVPHLEGLSEPLKILDGIEADVSRLVLCYQPLDRLIPGLDILTPADLASAAARAGWTIERFETLAGRIRLMVTRG
ncbi:MAG: glycosyltransferase [Phycisphaerae bacterium]|jgi:glycosyltransferase involved in cell wall biosynthesis